MAGDMVKGVPAKAVIPAAGLGTRFLPATKAQPKEMLPIVDTPVIQYVVQEAVMAGLTDILMVTGRGKRAIEDHFDRSVELEHFLRAGNKEDLLGTVLEIADLADIHFIRQKQPMGLGHAVLQARRHVGDEPFALLLGDEIFDAEVPCIQQVLAAWRSLGTESTVLAIREVPRDETRKYGVIDGEEVCPGVYRVVDLVEKPDPREAPSCFAVIGRYVIHPAVFDAIQEVPPGAGGEIQLTDALRLMVRSGRPVYGIAVNGRRYDVGDRLGFLQATVEFALKRKDIGPEFARYLQDLLLTKSG